MPLVPIRAPRRWWPVSPLGQLLRHTRRFDEGAHAGADPRLCCSDGTAAHLDVRNGGSMPWHRSCKTLGCVFLYKLQKPWLLVGLRMLVCLCFGVGCCGTDAAVPLLSYFSSVRCCHLKTLSNDSGSLQVPGEVTQLGVPKDLLSVLSTAFQLRILQKVVFAKSTSKLKRLPGVFFLLRSVI